MPPTHPGNRTKAQLRHFFYSVCSFGRAVKNHPDKFLKRRFPWRFHGLLQWNLQSARLAGYSGRWWQSLAKWGVWSTWRGQVPVLPQNLLCNKSAATDFAASSPLHIQAAWKNRTCYVSVQNQRRKLNSTQRRIFAGCINWLYQDSSKDPWTPHEHPQTPEPLQSWGRKKESTE